MKLQIYKEYYILSDNYSFIVSKKKKQIFNPFSNNLTKKKNVSFEDDENDFETSENDFEHLSYHATFLNALNDLKHILIRKSKASNITEFKLEMKDIQEQLSSFFNEKDYLYLLELSTKIRNPTPFTISHVNKIGSIDKKNPFSEEQIKGFKK